MNKIRVKFPKGIDKVHIPFTPDMGSYDQLHLEMSRINYPKRARRIEASILCSIDLRKGQTSYELAEIVVYK